MSQWIEDNYDNPERMKMYNELANMAAEGLLHPPKNEFVPLSDYKEVMKNCMKGFKSGKYIFDLS